MNFKSKIIIGVVLVSITIGVALAGLGHIFSTRVNAFVVNLADKMSNELGHPVSIEKVTIKWEWLLLKVNIKNLKIIDKEQGVPLFMASEIVSTVDTLDSIRSLSLRFKRLLLRSPRLVVQWNGTQLPTVLGLGHENVAGQFDPEAIFKILAMQRSIIIENGDLHLQGKNGADLPFMDLRLDFKQHGDHEFSMIARGNVAAAIQPQFIVAVKYFGDLDDFAKAMIEFEVKTSNLYLTELFNFVPKFKQNLIQGSFAELDVKGTLQNGTLRSVVSDFNITDLIIDHDTAINGGIGRIEYKPGENSAHFQLANLSLCNEKIYSRPINLDAISGNFMHAVQEDGKISLNLQDARIKLMDMELRANLGLLAQDQQILDAAFSAKLTDGDIRKLYVLLPDRKLSETLIDWLKKSITTGSIDLIKANLHGRKFVWSLDFKDTEINFSSDWPSVHGIDATMTMQDGKLSIVASKASILDNPLRSLSANFTAYQDKEYANINISGSMDTTLETGLNYLQQTPLQNSLGNSLQSINPAGNMGLDLNLAINLARHDNFIDVNGSIDLHNAKAQPAGLDLPLENINGVLKFTQNSFTADQLKLDIYEQSATANITTYGVQTRNINIAVNMPLQMASLKRLIPGVNFDKVKGTTQIKANVELPLSADKHGKVIYVRSDLVGVEFAYPEPFNKVAKTKLPLFLQYNMQARNEDNLKFKLGMLDGVLFLKDRKLHGGRIAVGTKLNNVSESESLHIFGNIKQLDWSNWSPLMPTADTQDQLPVEIDLAFEVLKLYGEEYKPMRIKYISAKNQLTVDSSIVTGTITTNQDADTIDIKLDKLNVPENRIKDNNMLDSLREKRNANKLPLIQFYCEKLQFNKRVFNKVALELLPRTYGYEIMNFSSTNDHLLLQAQGTWQMDNQAVTTLVGNIYTQNFGKVMASWGYANSISRGKGQLNFSVHWDGSPMDFDVLKLSGTSHLDLRSGNLTNVNPGIGRIIGLLSLESIQRRLQLDFSDLLSKGFAFDKFIADIKLQPGSAMSDNIFINSPAAKIEMSGGTSIKSQDLDFTMFVTPKVGAGLPIAAAIAAGNPAVGAAIWLFDKASGSRISEITKYKYKVSGTWDKPKVDEIPSNNDNFRVAEQ